MGQRFDKLGESADDSRVRTPKVLLVGSYAEPRPVGANRLLAAQLIELRRRGADVSCLTWPHMDTWTGPVPDQSSDRLVGQPWLQVQREGAKFEVVSLPSLWSERPLREQEWESAVNWAMDALRALSPTLVHLHYWQNLWWVLEACRRLAIPSVYSAYDYGIGCLRTVLVRGDGALCHETPEPGVCARCILRGRGALGLANEAVAALPGGERLLTVAYGTTQGSFLARRQAVRMPVWRRTGANLERLHQIAPSVGALIATSPFAKSFFVKCGFREDRIHLMPWFHDQRHPSTRFPPSDRLVLGFLGRISTEKGLHVLLDALAMVRSARQVHLRIAGAFDSKYGESLRMRFRELAGSASVEWLGWLPAEAVEEFLPTVHALIVPSLWFDNTPAALVEGLAHKRPIIATDVASMTHLVRNEVSGLVFPMGDAAALARCIERLAQNPELVAKFSASAVEVPNIENYGSRLIEIYRSLASPS